MSLKDETGDERVGSVLNVPSQADSTSRPRRLAAGETLGRYQIVDLLGAGGMGEVYRALDTELDRVVAVKVLPKEVASDSARLSRFRHEANPEAETGTLEPALTGWAGSADLADPGRGLGVGREPRLVQPVMREHLGLFDGGL